MVWTICPLVTRLMEWCFRWVDRAVWKTFDAGSPENSDSEVEEPSEMVSPQGFVIDGKSRGTSWDGSRQVVRRSDGGRRSMSRELGAGHKFYAIRRGRTPGLYFSWADCSRQVTCHKGEEHKSFRTLAEAEEYLF
jgi:hypothetical protein